MKTALLLLLLVLSLAGNAVLYFHRAEPNSASLKPGKADAGGNTTARTGRADSATTEEVARVAAVWADLQKTDLKTLVERLRAAGFSPAMIRALVAAQVQEQFSARRKALLAQQEERPYWKSQQTFFLDPKIMSGLRDLGREQSNLLKQLLGPDGVPGSEEAQAYQHRQFGDLPRGKAEQLQSIVADYSDLRNQVYMTANGVMLPEDREKLAILEKEQRADLEAVLTPQELENYELRSSATANTLRSQLSLFSPTEDEFRAIFKVQQAFDEKYGAANAIFGAEQFRERQAHQSELLDQIKTVLTPDRVDAYKQAVDPAYQMVNRLVARLELPASAATEIVGVQQDISKRANVLRADSSLTTDVKNAQLNNLAQEAGTKLTSVLGARGLEAYKQYGGQWLQNLVPRQSPVGANH